MKNGTYKVSFEFEMDLKGFSNEEEANEAVQGLIEESIRNGEFPEVNFVLTEEIDMDYEIEEDEVQELNFEGVA